MFTCVFSYVTTIQKIQNCFSTPWRQFVALFQSKLAPRVNCYSEFSPHQLDWIILWNESHSVVSNSLRPHGLYSPWNSPGQNTGVGSLSLLQGSFQIQGLNPGFPHCRPIIYQLSHKRSPRILEWVAYPFCRWSSGPRNQVKIFCIPDCFYDLNMSPTK